MAVIRDRTKAIEKIEKALEKHKDKLWWVKIDKIDIENKHTGNIDHAEDIYCLSLGKNGGRPMLICGFKDSRNSYILHDELAHVNIGSLYTLNIPDSKTNKFYVRDFCNPVKQINIVEKPEISKRLLKGNLTGTNPSSPMRSGIRTVHFTSAAPIYMNGYDRQVLKNDSTLEQIIAMRHNLSQLDDYTKSLIIDVRKQLLEDENKVYALVSDKYDIYPHFCFRVVDKNDLENGVYLTQDYYKTYSKENIDENFVIPKTEYNICCAGLGSAGTGILDQVARLNYFDRYKLIDFDKVERKNLRNQFYGEGQIGMFKTNASTNNIRRCTRENIHVSTSVDKIENVTFDYERYKYFISGFDTIECRKYALDKIKSGEIETQYLIDARYKDLTSSLFFIDVNNKDEMEYYEELLMSNLEEFEKDKVYDFTLDEIHEQYYENIHNGGCARLARELGLYGADGYQNVCTLLRGGRSTICGQETCLNCIHKAVTNAKQLNKVRHQGCLAENIIHIYKLTSTWVTAAIRSIEDNNIKPFTHVDMTVEPIPREIIIKK